MQIRYTNLSNKWSFTLEWQRAIAKEVDKLIDAGFIKKVAYPNWLTNVVPVKRGEQVVDLYKLHRSK